MKRRTLIKGMAATLPSMWLSGALGNNFLKEQHLGEPIAKGPFNPSWESLQHYKTPEWFRDAKFGIWAHWGRNASRKPVTGMQEICTRKGHGNINFILKIRASFEIWI